MATKVANLIGPQGPQGPQGLQGPPGGEGPPGQGSTYIHVQSTLSSSWNVTHNLQKRPSVTVVDSGDSTIIPDVDYTDDNSLVILFGSATSGKAYLN